MAKASRYTVLRKLFASLLPSAVGKYMYKSIIRLIIQQVIL